MDVLRISPQGPFLPEEKGTLKERSSDLLILFLAGLCTFGALQGCASFDFASGVNGYTTEILPAYKAYVLGDTNLDAVSKRIRIRSADTFQKMVDEARRN
jgi:hypothetical protein